jgi:hypothetical protein
MPVAGARPAPATLRSTGAAQLSIGPRLKTPSPNNSGDPCIKAGCIEAGAGPWRGFPLRDFAKSPEEQR